MMDTPRDRRVKSTGQVLENPPQEMLSGEWLYRRGAVCCCGSTPVSGFACATKTELGAVGGELAMGAESPLRAPVVVALRESTKEGALAVVLPAAVAQLAAVGNRCARLTAPPATSPAVSA